MPLDVVGIPAIEHFEQDFVDQLCIGLCSAWIRAEGVEYPPLLLLCHHRQAEAQQESRHDSTEASAARHLPHSLIPVLIPLASHLFSSWSSISTDSSEKRSLKRHRPDTYLSLTLCALSLHCSQILRDL